MTVFANPPAPPSPFSFTSVASAYAPYGWRVAIERPAAEFSELRGAGPGGFELRGSGSALVTAAPYYRPRQKLKVEVRNLEGDSMRALQADRHGSLSLAVTLGPGNPYQEYSPLATAWLATRDLTEVLGQELNGPQGWPVCTAVVTVSRARG